VPEPVTVIEPDAMEPMVVMDAKVAWPATEGVSQGIEVAMVHTCALGGGDATASTRLSVVDEMMTIVCTGGVFSGDTCDFAAGLVTCFNEGAASPMEQPTDAPTEAPASPQVTAEPTSVPTLDATTTPTESPPVTTVPTEQPVIDPTVAPTDAGPWTVPTGTLPVFEPAEPTPTVVILT